MVGPLKKRSHLDERCLYKNCKNGKWKFNLANLKQWFEIAIILLFFSSWKNTTKKIQITIPDSCSFRAKVNLEAINASSNL
jgi:hypothetical protein